MKKINDYLTTPDLLCQLAEEASELAQAALKLKRAMEGTNPTPMSVEECVANMDEEIADVSLLVDLLGYNKREHLLSQGRVAYRKAERWLKRLEEAEGGGTNAQATQKPPVTASSAAKTARTATRPVPPTVSATPPGKRRKSESIPPDTRPPGGIGGMWADIIIKQGGSTANERYRLRIRH
jgi:hypothetical protein